MGEHNFLPNHLKIRGFYYPHILPRFKESCCLLFYAIKRLRNILGNTSIHEIKCHYSLISTGGVFSFISGKLINTESEESFHCITYHTKQNKGYYKHAPKRRKIKKTAEFKFIFFHINLQVHLSG